MLATLLSLTLSCLSAGDDGERTVASPNKAFTLGVSGDSMSLYEGEAARWPPPPGPGQPPPTREDLALAEKKPRWSAQVPRDAMAYAVSDDGTWVVVARAMPRLMDPERAVVTVFDGKSEGRDFDVLSQLTVEERKALPRTNCGSPWLAALRPSSAAVEIDIYQGSDPFRAPWLVTVRLEVATGAMTRIASSKPEKKPTKKK